MSQLMRMLVVIASLALASIGTAARAQEAEEEPIATDAEPAYVVVDAPQPAPAIDAPQLAPSIDLPLPAPTLPPLPTPSAAPELAGNAIVAAAVIDNRFQPTTLAVTVGSTVTWTNNGNNIHTLTSPDGLFDSGGLLAGQSFSFTFDKSGTFRVICRQHGLNGMAGQITVQ